MNHRLLVIGLRLSCWISLALGGASLADSTERVPALRMEQGLSAVPANRAERPEPPSLENVQALADYYFVRYPELTAPPEVIERLARYYCLERPDLDMPGKLLDTVVHHYRFTRPELRPPSGLQDRVRLRGRAVVRSSTSSPPPIGSGDASAPGVIEVPAEVVVVAAPDPVAPVDEAVMEPASEAPEPSTPVESPPDEADSDPEGSSSSPVIGAELPSVPANAEPAVAIRRDRPSIAEGEPMLLKAGISFEKSPEQLSALLLERFQEMRTEAAAVPDQTGKLHTDWSGVTEISARIANCPDFLTCLAFQERMKLRTDLMEWNWSLSLNSGSDKVPESFLTAIEFRAFRGNATQDKTGAVVQALPPMRLKFHRVCDGDCVKGRIRWVAEVLEEGENAFAKLRNLLIAIAAVATLIAGWFGWRKKREE